MGVQAEEQRLQALWDLGVLDTPVEERFDRVVRLAQRVFDVPMAAVTLIDDDRQWVKAEVGLSHRETARRDAFCDRTIRQPGPLVVTDAAADARFRDLPSVTVEKGIRFYAGQPLRAPTGQRIGALCIIDRAPRRITDDELALLRDLADWVEKELAMDAEWGRAAEVQQRLLPSAAPDIPDYQLAGRCLMARQVGGDFFDWYTLGDQLQLVVADVMGKGLSAALLAASVRAVLHGTSRFNPVEEAVTRTAFSVERDLSETATFVTLFAARLLPATGELRYVDAGHGLSLVMDGRGGCRRLESDELPLGVLPRTRWNARSTVLAPGETLLSVSDGYLDFFGSTDEALAAAVRVNAESGDVEQMVSRMAAFCGRQVAQDDVTMVVLRRAATQ